MDYHRLTYPFNSRGFDESKTLVRMTETQCRSVRPAPFRIEPVPTTPYHSVGCFRVPCRVSQSPTRENYLFKDPYFVLSGNEPCGEVGFLSLNYSIVKLIVLCLRNLPIHPVTQVSRLQS